MVNSLWPSVQKFSPIQAKEIFPLCWPKHKTIFVKNERENSIEQKSMTVSYTIQPTGFLYDTNGSPNDGRNIAIDRCHRTPL